MRRIIVTLILIIPFFSLRANNNEHSLTFAQAADLAVAASVDLKYAYHVQKIKEGAWKWGLRSYFPTVGFNVSENDRLQQIGQDSFIKNYTINAEQLLWDGGKIALTRKLEKNEINLSAAELDNMAVQIAETALSAYRRVLSNRSILEIKENSLVVLENQRRILREEVRLGLSLYVDLVGADINIANFKLEIYSLKLDLAEMERQFAELLGLEALPELTEKVDVKRSVYLPPAVTAGDLSRERNHELNKARLSVNKRQAELKYIRNSWIPTFKLAGNFSLTGQEYPLTHYNWSVGVIVDFTGPWLQNKFVSQYGKEVPNTKTAVMQNSANLLPEPAMIYNKKQAEYALIAEMEKFTQLYEHIGKIASNAVEKCRLADQKRILASEMLELTSERCKLDELRLSLGHITRINLMESLIEKTQKEVALLEAAVAMLEAERELELFMNLKPGELSASEKSFKKEKL